LKRNTIFLHIGLEKTGSTSIQSVLAENNEVLQLHGYDVPAEVFRRKNHIELTTSVCNPDHIGFLYEAENKVKFREKVSCYILEHNKNDIVFSGEHLSSRLLSKSEIINLNQLLCSKYHNIQVVVYVRSYSSWILSSYSEALKGGFAGAVEDFIALKKPVRIWSPILNPMDKILSRWINVFGKKNVHIYSFDKAVSEGLEKHFFTNVLGLDGTLLTISKEKANPSLRVWHSYCLIFFNKIFGFHRYGYWLRKALVALLVRLNFGNSLSYKYSDNSFLIDYCERQQSNLDNMYERESIVPK
jgi:hypothetical protein